MNDCSSYSDIYLCKYLMGFLQFPLRKLKIVDFSKMILIQLQNFGVGPWFNSKNAFFWVQTLWLVLLFVNDSIVFKAYIEILNNIFTRYLQFLVLKLTCSKLGLKR